MAEKVRLEDVDVLSEQFSKLGSKFVYHICIRFIDNLKREYPNVPEKDFVRLMINTFKESNIQIDVRSPTKKVDDKNRCAKILQTGKNKGNRCSLQKTEGSEFCKRHRDKVFVSYDKKNPLQRKQMKDYLDVLQPKVSEIKKPEPLKLRQYKEDNVYLEATTKMVFHKNSDDEFIAFGIYVEGKGILGLSDDDINLCEINSWKYQTE